MGINGVSLNNALGPVGNAGSSAAPGIGKGVKDGPSFQQTLDQLRGPSPEKLGVGVSESLKFSNHAVERMRTRGVNFGPEQMQKLNSAVEKARAKGAKETLVLADNAALIVSVKNNTVVTVMDSQALKENVFTNIDSTVVI